MRVIDLSTLSLVGGSGIAEAKILLWGADGTSSTSSSTYQYGIQDGSGVFASSAGTSPQKLFTLSSTWNPNTKIALEVTFEAATNGNTVGYQIYDFNTSSFVSSSSVSTTSASYVTIRSGQATLTPGHSYGVLPLYTNTGYVTDASLIIFP